MKKRVAAERRILAVLLSLMMVVSLTPSVALAEDETKSLEVSWDDCISIGEMEDYECDILLYDKEVPEGVSQIVFTDEAGNMEGDYSFITTWEMGPAYVYQSNTVSVTDAYKVENSDLHGDEAFSLKEEYEEEEFEDCFGFLIYDDEDESYFVLIPIPGFSGPSLPDVSFTATIDGEPVPDSAISEEEGGYLHIPYGGTEGDPYGLKTIVIPQGTAKVDFRFSQACLAYNYKGVGTNPVTVDENDMGSFIGEFIEDATTGITNFKANIDNNADGFMDCIQVQNLYSPDWMSGGELLYAITFRYDLFNAFVDGQAMSKVEKTENGYTPYGYDWVTWEQIQEPPVPLYTVTVPEGTQALKLVFPGNRLAYNYDGQDNYIAGEFDYTTGVKEVNIEIDADGNGIADYIRVQNPGSSDALYAITFEGAELPKPEEPETVEGDAETILHNIAAGYAKSGAAGDENAPWIAADMMAYEKAFPDKGNKLSDAQKQAMTDEAIAALEKDSLKVGDAAKYVLALVSMGYDPAQLTTSTGEALDGKARLDALTFDGDGKVTKGASNAYTLPYVIIAYQQFEDSQEALEKLEETAVETKDAWMDTTVGVDGMTPMMLALAESYNADNAAGAALDGAVAAVKAAQTKSGSIGSYINASTDGLAAVGFAALGIDPAGVTYKDYPEAASLLTGLVSLADPTQDGFGNHNSWNTEQGFRGLLAASQVQEGKKYRIYDFSGQELKPAAASRGNVLFRVVPENAAVSLKSQGGEEIAPADGKLYDLPEGEYDYTVSCDGYRTKTGVVTVTAQDIRSHAKITEKVSLLREAAPADSGTVKITVQVLAHGSDCDNSITYKNNPDKYSSLLSGESYTATLVKNEGTARDALVEALDDSGITYEEVSNGYFPTIGEYTEFGHGTNSGWLYMVNGKAGTSAMKDVTFSQDGTLTLFYTDDYSRDYGSENWGGGGSGGGNDDSDDPSDQPGPDGYYDDTKGHWAEEAIDSITERGLMNGVAERKFAPDMTLSRAMFVTMLWRLDGEPYEEGTAQAGMNYSDVDGDDWYYKAVLWGVKNDIVKGTSDTTFSPDASLTREQMATFLYRYKNGNGRLETEEDPSASPQNDISAISSYTDADQVSSWAKEAVTWAIANGIINGVSEKKLAPQGTATRAQAATILLRYIDKHSL